MRKSGLVVLAAFLAAGCGGDGGGGKKGIARVAGTWQVESGSFLSEDEIDTGTFSFLEIGADGTVDLYSSYQPLGMPGCGRVGLSVVDDNVLQITGVQFAPEQLLRYERSGSTLRLIDGTGAETVLRRAAIPATSKCGTTETLRSFTVERPESRSGLVFDGSLLWFESDLGGLRSIDPVTGAAGPNGTIPFSQFTHLHAFQGTDYWTHCGCGDGRYAQRRNSVDFNALDEVDTTILGHPMSVRGLAWDGTSLWLTGNSHEGLFGKILRIASDAEPDTLTSALTTEAFFTGITPVGDGRFWLVSRSFGYQAVLYDPAAATMRSFRLPEGNWFGVALLPAGLFLLGSDESNIEGRIILVRTVDPS